MIWYYILLIEFISIVKINIIINIIVIYIIIWALNFKYFQNLKYHFSLNNLMQLIKIYVFVCVFS